jgi:hypothetical protein
MKDTKKNILEDWLDKHGNPEIDKQVEQEAIVLTINEVDRLQRLNRLLLTALKGEHKGISILVRNEYEFNQLKKYLGEDILYLDWVPQMGERETAVIISYEDTDFFPMGSVGAVSYQEKHGVKVHEFKEFF